jgi:hypothetical protein
MPNMSEGCSHHAGFEWPPLFSVRGHLRKPDIFGGGRIRLYSEIIREIETAFAERSENRPALGLAVVPYPPPRLGRNLFLHVSFTRLCAAMTSRMPTLIG